MRFVLYRRVGLSVVGLAVLLAVTAVCAGCWETGSFGALNGEKCWNTSF